MQFESDIRSKTDSELLDMVYEFDKWSPEFLNAVESELIKRNILPADIQDRKSKLIEQETRLLSQSREASPFGLAIGWLGCFGLIGIFVGHNYAFSEIKSRYTDQKFHKYNEATRRTGKNMFWLSIILSSLMLAWQFIELLAG